jgi:hypothetical protein
MTYAATPEAKADVFDHIERLHYPKPGTRRSDI